MNYEIREMRIEDYQEIFSFWESCKDLNIDESDSYENLEKYLKRNPGLSYVAMHDNKIIGTIKCAQDGRRGYLHHLAVEDAFRNLGIAKEMINKSIQSLKDQGIERCIAYVLDTNSDVIKFWEHNGWNVVNYSYRTLQIDI